MPMPIKKETRFFLTSLVVGSFLFGISTETFANPITYGTSKSSMDKYAENQIEKDGGNLSENGNTQKGSQNKHTSFEDDNSSDPVISVRKEKVSTQKESVQSVERKTEEKKENTYQPKPYQRRYVYDQVDIYHDGQIVERVPLFKEVIATPTKKEGKVGRDVRVRRQYVRGWTVNNDSRIPILDTDESSQFYEENENHQADVENM